MVSSAADRVLGDGSDLAVLDADVGDGVIHRLRVHDPAVEDHEVVVGRQHWRDHR